MRNTVDCVYKYYSFASFDSCFLSVLFMWIKGKYEVLLFYYTKLIQSYILKEWQKYNIFYNNALKIKDWIPYGNCYLVEHVDVKLNSHINY